MWVLDDEVESEKNEGVVSTNSLIAPTTAIVSNTRDMHFMLNRFSGRATILFVLKKVTDAGRMKASKVMCPAQQTTKVVTAA